MYAISSPATSERDPAAAIRWPAHLDEFADAVLWLHDVLLPALGPLRKASGGRSGSVVRHTADWMGSEGDRTVSLGSLRSRNPRFLEDALLDVALGITVRGTGRIQHVGLAVAG